ncbi:MAG: hypothetical protein OQK01_14630 [Xanthomonadales bacterium]|jgi:hypothetical protein|nr:hypothetical protein [Xanthomonadales bacterium]
MKIFFFLISVYLATGIPGFAQASGSSGSTHGTPTASSLGGHVKYRFIHQSFPDDSVYRDLLGSAAIDQYLETRLKLAARRERWDLKADYQLIAIHADTLPLAEQLPGSALPVNAVINDDRRWWNLTYGFGDSSRTAFVHRLDRLSIGFTSERTAWRFGRQAISWGNGMVFTPMDVFNPFDPAAVDREYKTGDDMLYGQYGFDNGNDLQGVAVVRRDPFTGRVEMDHSSLAFKYHGFLGMNEYDLLAAEHYGDRILGLGGNLALGGAVWRGDLTWTRTDRDDLLSAVTSLSYSWNWGARNISGVLEFYHNGFGQENSAYAPADLLRNPDLLRRVERGELFTLARNYLALSATIEMSPLFLLTPNLFVNLDDPSALAQLVAQCDVRQNLLFIAALNIPIGPAGSEYGGIESPVDGRYFASGPGLFAQIAWYF